MNRLETLEFRKGEVDHHKIESQLPLFVSRIIKKDLGDFLRYSFPLREENENRYDSLLNYAKRSNDPIRANRTFRLEEVLLAKYFLLTHSVPHQISLRRGRFDFQIIGTPTQFRLLRYSFEKHQINKSRYLYGQVMSLIKQISH